MFAKVDRFAKSKILFKKFQVLNSTAYRFNDSEDALKLIMQDCLVNPVNPANPVNPVNPANPVNQAKPVNPANPVNPDLKIQVTISLKNSRFKFRYQSQIKTFFLLV